MAIPRWLIKLLSSKQGTEVTTLDYVLPVRLTTRANRVVGAYLVLAVPTETARLHHGCIKDDDTTYNEEMGFRKWVDEELDRLRAYFELNGVHMKPIYPDRDHCISDYRGGGSQVNTGTAEHLCGVLANMGATCHEVSLS